MPDETCPRCRVALLADGGAECPNCGAPRALIGLRVRCPELLRVGTNAVLRFEVASRTDQALSALSLRLANGPRFLTADSDVEDEAGSLAPRATAALELQVTPKQDGRVGLDLTVQLRDAGRDDWIHAARLYVRVAPAVGATPVGAVGVNVDGALVRGGITVTAGGQEVLADPGDWADVPLTLKERVRFEPRPIDVGVVLDGRYRVERLLGRGAFGAVFRAAGLGPGREGLSYAIKTLRPELRDNPKLRRAFEREAAITAGLTHPNIVRLWDVGARDDVPYLAMEHLDGPTGDELLADQPDGLTVDEVARIGEAVCAALQHAHDHDVFHRDVKPSNVILAGDGTPKLTDFNLARVVKSQMSHLSDKGSSGTVVYMSLDQILNRPPTPQQDLWSLGVTLYELLTGETPFSGSAEQVLLQIRERQIEPPDGAPPWLADAVLRCLARDPADAWPDAAALGAALADRGRAAEVEAEREAREAAAREARETAAREEREDAAREAAERAAREQAAREAREQAERRAAEEAARRSEAERRAADERRAREAADPEARDAALRAEAEQEAAADSVEEADAIEEPPPERVSVGTPRSGRGPGRARGPGRVAGIVGGTAVALAAAIMCVGIGVPALSRLGGDDPPARAGDADRDADADASSKPATTRSGGKPAPSSHRPLTWVSIPAGSFEMGGRDHDSYDDEKPPHRVTLPAFKMSATEVTVGQYGECVADGPCEWPDAGYDLCNHDGDGPRAGKLDHPMNCVSWHEATTFASWKGGGLPSEAQWEYAARAGTTTRFSSGDADADLDGVGWYDDNADGTTHPVAEKAANPWGLYDMHGNVWEWCEDDWHGRYDGAPDDGSAWVDSPRGARRVYRGGCFWFDARGCRSAYRDWGSPSDRWNVLGFRVVLPAPEQAG